MAFDEGFNFRSTLGFVTDPTDTQFVDGTLTYPQTAGGVTFGWISISNVVTRDRNSGVDARLAGIHRTSGGPQVFQVDLPATGQYEVRVAVGDANYPDTGINYALFDNTTQVFSFSNLSTSAGGHFLDATGVERTSVADWISNNAAVTYNFASTVLQLQIDIGFAGVSHLRIVQVDTGPTPGPTAFEGFQSNAFQGPAGYLPKRIDTAFQQNAFQDNAFQIRTRASTDSVGTLAVTLDDVTLAATGKVKVQGTLSKTLDAVTLSGTGKVPSHGTASITLDDVTLAATGKIKVQGTAGITLDDLTLSAHGGTRTIRTAFQGDAFQQNAFQILAGGAAEEEVPGAPNPSESSRRHRRRDEEPLALLLQQQIIDEDREILKIIEAFLEQGTVYRMAA